jgi:hypothetical protein
MNESDLEKELAALQPAEPSRAWSERVALAMAIDPRTDGVHSRSGVIVHSISLFATLRRFGWVLAGSAATALLIVTLHPTPVADVPAANVAASLPEELMSPVQTARAFIEAEEEEVFDTDSQVPARRVRFVFLERHTWTDPQTGALIAVEVPREDIFLLPLAMQ